MNSPSTFSDGGGSHSKPVGSPASVLRFAWLFSWVLLSLPASAMAENPPAFVLKWGSLGQATGQFDEARSVA